MRKVVKLVMALGFVVSSVYGQSPRGNYDPANRPKESKISGKIIDQGTAQPVEYATIRVFSARDSTLVSGGSTDGTGAFTVGELPYGRFYVDISFLGYKKSRINNIGLNPNQKIANLGEVKLQPSYTSLSEVEVVGNKNPMEYRIDKKVINVGQNVTATGGTAVDVLQNTPSVQVDVEGNVSLRGSSNFTVLIDGKPSVLKGSEALQQLPAATIQNIEIITNPSAKYDPTGTAGIINVVMKKSKQTGINGVVNSSVSNNGSYSADFLVNIRSGKVNYYLGADYNKRVFKNTRYMYQEDYETADTAVQVSNANGKFNRDGYGVKGGIDITLDKINSISVSGSLRRGIFGRASTSYNHDYYLSSVKPEKYYVDNNDPRVTRNFYEISVDHTMKFNDSGHQLVNSFSFSDENSTDNENLSEVVTNSSWIGINALPFKQLTVEDETEKEFRFKSDYSYPINEKAKLEAGYQYQLQKTSDSYHFYDTTSVNPVYSTGLYENSAKANDKDYKQEVHSIYSTYSNSTKFVDFQLGLRVEYMNRNLTQNIIKKSDPYSMWDYFPTIHLSKKLPHDFQVQASYTRRINRPDERDLDPFISYMDTKRFRKGNPALEPEYTNSYELNFQKSFNEAGFVSIEGFHRQTKNLISRWVYTDTTLHATVMTSKNINSDYSTGAELMINMPLSKWWVLNSSASVYHYKLDSLNGSSSTVTWNSRFSSMFRFKWGMQVQVTGFYNAPSITAQGSSKGFFFTNIGVRQDILKRKATISLQIRDLFQNSGFRNTVNSGSSYIYSKFMRETRVFTLTLSYKINNYKQQQRRDQQNQMNESDFDGGGGIM